MIKTLDRVKYDHNSIVTFGKQQENKICYITKMMSSCLVFLLNLNKVSVAKGTIGQTNALSVDRILCLSLWVNRENND